MFVGASVHPTDPYDHFKVPLILAESDVLGGVELAATAFLNLLHRERMFSLPPPAQAGVVLCYAFVALLASQFLGGRRALIGVMMIAAAYGATAVAAFVLARFWVPVSVPLIIVTPYCGSLGILRPVRPGAPGCRGWRPARSHANC